MKSCTLAVWRAILRTKIASFFHARQVTHWTLSNAYLHACQDSRCMCVGFYFQNHINVLWCSARDVFHVKMKKQKKKYIFTIVVNILHRPTLCICKILIILTKIRGIIQSACYWIRYFTWTTFTYNPQEIIIVEFIKNTLLKSLHTLMYIVIRMIHSCFCNSSWVPCLS